jgi:hypothetical protein
VIFGGPYGAVFEPFYAGFKEVSIFLRNIRGIFKYRKKVVQCPVGGYIDHPPFYIKTKSATLSNSVIN